jgi:hypothetical protein
LGTKARAEELSVYYIGMSYTGLAVARDPVGGVRKNSVMESLKEEMSAVQESKITGHARS